MSFKEKVSKKRLGKGVRRGGPCVLDIMETPSFSLYTQACFQYARISMKMFHAFRQDKAGTDNTEQMSLSYNNPPTFIIKKIRTAGLATVSALSLFLSGCTMLTAVPVTIKEVKDYVVGRDQSYSCPLDKVLRASVYNLRNMGFTILRIESFNQKGLVQADWEMTSVKLSMETITPKLTKVIVKVKSSDNSREYSSEDELFANIRETLKEEKEIDWEGLLKGMVTVHLKPNDQSPIIAYLAPGALTNVVREEGQWVKIGLMDNCTGYIANHYLE